MRRWLMVPILFAALIASAVRGQTTAPAAPDERPRLFVVLVVDQLRADFVTRCERHFGDDGFRRLLLDGALFTNAYFSYGATVTAPGHATLVTGRLPRDHGVIANQWYVGPDDKNPASAFTDPAEQAIGAGEGEKAKGRSPRALIGPTLGDQLKLHDRRARVVSIAMKARAAIAMGGHQADAVLWWSDESGHWLSSTYYSRELPSYAAEFNSQRRADRFAGLAWTPLLPTKAYAGLPVTPRRATVTLPGLSGSFPYELPSHASRPKPPYYEAVLASPFGQELTLELAMAAVDAEQLGRDEVCDLLCVSLSSFDVAGHLFGPDSAEMFDFTIRTDRQIGELLRGLDERVGRGRWLLALAADHGVTTSPDVAQAHRLGGMVLDTQRVIEQAETAMRAAVGAPQQGRYVRGIEVPWLYMGPACRALEPEQRRRAMEAAVSTLRGDPGVRAVFTADDLHGPPPPPDDLERYLAYRCYHAGRSGDIYLAMAAYCHKQGGDVCGHSAGSTHDRHVPIMLMGPAVRAGRFATPVDPMDLAPTLAALLGIEPPLGARGRVLHEAVDMPRY